MHHLARYFIRGLIVVVPAVLTAWVVYQIFVWVDTLVPFAVPGTGFLLTIATIVAIGFLASNFVTRKLFDLLEKLFSRAPIARILYVAIRDLVEAFVGDRKKFNRPVLVTLSTDLRAVGFLTRDDLSFLGADRHVAVYFPQSYNFAGNLVIVPADKVEPIDADAARLMAFVVSGGVS
ncbi:MAG: DUF502 domain-containing protein [Thermoanaerobaculia bacterium]|nr:DUF502 domain-containing protein [Thermoanaerobaculia bacterium]